MAQREAIFNLKLNTGNTVEDLNKIDKGFEEISKSSEDAAKGTGNFEHRLAEIDKQAKSGDMSMRQLNKLVQQYQQVAREAGVNTPVGQDAIAKAAALRDELGDLNARVNALASDSANLDAAMTLGQGVVGGYQAAQGVMASLGVENEALLETMVKLQAAQSIMNGLKAIEATLNKDSIVMIKAQALGTTMLTAAKAAYSAVVGTATGALKLFRLALISTGIGAIVVAVGLLIANFEKLVSFVQQGIQKFRELGNGIKIAIAVMFPIVGIIWGIIEALEYFGIIEDETTKKANASAKAQREAQQQILNAKRKAIDGQIKENERLMKSTATAYDWEIAKAQAAGKSTTQLEQMKRAEMRKTLEAQIVLLEESIKLNATNAAAMVSAMKQVAEARANIVKLDQETELAAIRMQTERTKAAQTEAQKREEIAREEAKRMAQIRAEMLATIEQLEEENFQKTLSDQERELTASQYKFDLLLAQAEGHEDEIARLTELARLERLAIEEKYELERQDKIRQLQEQFLLTDQEREMMEIERRREARMMEIEQMVEDEELKQQLLAAVQQKYNEEKAEIDKKYYEQDKSWAEKSTQEKMELVSQYLSHASGLLNSLSALNEAVTNNQLKKAKGNAVEEEKIRKKSFERNKKLQIAQAVIAGIQGVMAAFVAGSSMGPAGVVMGPLMAGLAAVAAVANVAKIASTQYEGGGNPSPTVPDTSSASAEMAGFSSSNSGTTALNPDGTVQGQEPQNQVQVVVLESDITTTQNNMQQVDVRSTF
jgi:hypothetical protein